MTPLNLEYVDIIISQIWSMVGMDKNYDSTIYSTVFNGVKEEVRDIVYNPVIDNL